MIVVDGLQCGRFDGGVFGRLRQGALGCVTVTCGFWESAVESLDALGHWRDLATEHADLVTVARTVDDVLRAQDEGRVALILGFQNTNAFEARIRFVELFHELGIRVAQLTYNNQNEAGSSCYEAHDAGLTRYGRQLVAEMNRVGMMVDLSHVGERTSLDAITTSDVPVAITHANPSALVPHPRNKSTELLRALAEHDGVLGCAVYPNICGDYADSLTSWSELVARTVELIGVDHVGIGTDIGHNQTDADFDWMRRGRWTRGVDYGAGSAKTPGPVHPPSWMGDGARFSEVADALERRGFSTSEVEQVMGGNWLRLYQAVWAPD